MKVPKLRRLRIFQSVLDWASISAGADALGLSQPAASRAIMALEAEVGFRLANRSQARLTATPEGAVLIRRTRRAFAHLKTADERLFRSDLTESDRRWVLRDEAADHELHSAIAIAEAGSVGAASRGRGVSQPALTRSLSTLENRLGCKLFQRALDGMRPTREGEIVVRFAKLAYTEIDQALDELAHLGGLPLGRIRIGALPLTRARLIPSAIADVLVKYPSAQVTVRDAGYDDLKANLENGDVDLIVGTLRDDQQTSRQNVVLFEDNLAVIARAGHPLCGQVPLTLNSISGQEWVLPFEGVPLRVQFDSALHADAAPPPAHIVETDSTAVVRGILLQSDRLAVVSRLQVSEELDGGLLSVLPVAIEHSTRLVGVMFRPDYEPTPLVAAFTQALERAALRLIEP